jgi:hypothetical protein
VSNPVEEGGDTLDVGMAEKWHPLLLPGAFRNSFRGFKKALVKSFPLVSIDRDR